MGHDGRRGGENHSESASTSAARVGDTRKWKAGEKDELEGEKRNGQATSWRGTGLYAPIIGQKDEAREIGAQSRRR